MAETNTGTPAPDTQPEKTFTQEDVNKIVGDRIAREREKFADYDAIKAKAEKFDEIEEANKSELEKAQERANKLQTELDSMKAAEQVRAIRDEVAKETGVPSNLLTADTKEGCEEQAKAIKAYTESNRPGYPSVRDSGEATTSTKGTTKEQFEDWVKNLG